MMTWAKRWGIPVLGVALLVWGTNLVVANPVSFGWLAAAPVSGEAFVVQPPLNAGAFVAALGLMLVSGWIGFLLGRRRSPADPC